MEKKMTISTKILLALALCVGCLVLQFSICDRGDANSDAPSFGATAKMRAMGRGEAAPLITDGTGWGQRTLHLEDHQCAANPPIFSDIALTGYVPCGRVFEKPTFDGDPPFYPLC